MVNDINFYVSGLGDQLIDESSYPQSIKDFLCSEEAYLNLVSSSFDTLVEVGCMHGRYLDWAVEHGKKYIGIDLVERYIDAGISKAASSGLNPKDYKFILGSAEDLPELLFNNFASEEQDKMLLFFPFNCIGNMSGLSAVLQSIRQTGLLYLISTYRTEKYANQCRLEYYQKGRFKRIKMQENDGGVLFTSEDNLCTMAYHIDYFRSQCDQAGLDCIPIILSDLLVVYENFQSW